ncbi:MAG: hypothetical protein VCA73_17275 [Roseibacillus sp.]|jgi:hypothetical protein|tara:strand:+ start:300 stop:461 length:162 start_codon:yes stop_codon:yes gene_type:complete
MWQANSVAPFSPSLERCELPGTSTTDGQRLYLHRNGKREKVGELSLTEMVKWI